MKKSIIWIILTIQVLVFSCKKEKESVPDKWDTEALSKEDVLILDSLQEATGFDSSSVVLPNGQRLDAFIKEVDSLFYNQWFKTAPNPYDNLGPQDARNLLIARISAVALNLTDRSKYQKPDEGIGRPSQNGIAYSWGSKNYKVRQRPPGINPKSVCMYEIYGLDCSGFIYQLFTNAGVSLLSGPADSQRKSNILESAIKASIPALNKIKVEELGAISPSNFDTGDIIYWTNSDGRATHIGIILKDLSNKLAVFQSGGFIGEKGEECFKNLDNKRGPLPLQLNDPYWFGADKKYGITRINADVSGRWSLFLRCTNETNDAMTLQLVFQTSQSNSFEVAGTGIDYDAKTVNCSGTLSYKNFTNVLTGTLYITKPSSPNFYRYDSFSIKLDRDETGYFSLVLGNNVDAGCALEGRLNNNE